MFRFANPLWLLLLVFPVWIFIGHFFKKKKNEATVLFSDIRIFKRIGHSSGRFKRLVSLFILVEAVSLLIIAMARPQMGQTVNERSARGIDIILALDISSSMEAMDFHPQTRIEAAKDVVRDFVTLRKSDRIGLIVFAAQSFTLCPLTLDYDIVADFLERADESRLEDGTAIGSAIATSVNRLRESDAKNKVVILLTDGMNNRGKIDPLTAARIAETFNIRIYTIGVGSEGKAPIRVDGRTVYAETHIDEVTLKEVSKITNGNYYRAKNTHELMGIYEEIDRLETSKIKYKEWVEYDEMYVAVMRIGFLLLVLSFILDRTFLRRLP